jgi:hypothetical protein
MAERITESDVREWLADLPEMVSGGTQCQPEPHAQFKFVVDASGFPITVYRVEPDGPLVIAVNLTLGGNVLEAVHDQRDRFFAEVGSVLTNSPGIYAYTDDQENNVPDEEFSTVVIRHWIYPDSLGQHRVTTDIIDIVNAATYVRDTAERLKTQPDLLR